MKRVIAVLLLMLCLPMVVSAQEQGWASKFFTNGLTHNFGNVAHGAVLTHKFTIKNIYEVPFVVADAKVSCGCVTPIKPKGEIQKNGSAEFDIEMDTRRITPGTVKTVTIFVTMMSVAQKPGDKIYSSMAYLSVTCIPQGNISCNPDRVNFGIVTAGQSPTASITVSHRTNRQWSLDVGKNDLPFDVTIQRGAPVRGFASIYQINVTLRKNAPAGEFKHELQLQTTDPATPVLPITVEGIIQAALTATPNNINFGNVKVNEGVSRAIIVRGNGKPFRIVAADGAEDGLNIKFGADPKVAQVVTIEYIPKKAGPLKKSITLKTDQGAEMSVSVTIEGAASP